jgi:type II secretory pathway pseudopilin PulG
MAELKKIKSSTLIESIVAMVIITISFSSAFLILSAVSGKNNPQLRFKALIEAQRALDNCKNSGNLQNQDWQLEGLKIEKVIKPFHEFQGLRQIEISVYNNSGKPLIHRTELISVPE